MKKKNNEFKSLFEYYDFSKSDEKKYPVISSILKQLTPERIKAENEAVSRVELPPEIQRRVREYEKVGDPSRNEYIWKWIFKTTSMITSPSVAKKYHKSLPIIKAYLFMFDTLLDDVADKSQERSFLDELNKIPFEQDCMCFNNLTPKEKKYFYFTKKVWNYIERTIYKYPRYEEFKNLFQYDILQLLNTMRYSCLINTNPYLMNKSEFWAYLPHNMTVMICCTIDLMCSPKLNIRELGKIREIFWLAQKMTRIGNWVSTWKREIGEKDFTSGIWPYAIDKRIINNITEIQKNKKEKTIQAIRDSDTEKTLLIKWEENYINILELSKLIKSFNVKKLLLMLEGSILMHLSSTGYK